MKKARHRPLKLQVYYDPETDTLSLWNGLPACEASEVGEGLTADFDADGEVVGITLDGASRLLTPHIWERSVPNPS